MGVGEVLDDTPASKAGLKEGDTIVEVAGKPTPSLAAYSERMATLKAGDTIEVVVVRDGKKMTLNVKLE